MQAPVDDEGGAQALLVPEQHEVVVSAGRTEALLGDGDQVDVVLVLDRHREVRGQLVQEGGECQPGRCEAYRSRPVLGSKAPGVPMTTRWMSARVSPASFTAPSSASVTWRTTLSARRPGVASSNCPTVLPVTSATAATMRRSFTSSPATWAARAFTM